MAESLGDGMAKEREKRNGAAQVVQPVAPSDLVAFSGTSEARHMARLEADQMLMLRLSVEGFGGDTWDLVATGLVEYGYAVMRAWISSGLVFLKCRERGISLSSPTDIRPSPDDVADIAEDVVADAIINFRDRVLRAGRWDPARGASLTTYFVGNCLIQFPNEHRRWYRRTSRDRAHAQGLDALSPLAAARAFGRPDDVPSHLEATDTFRRILSAAGDETNRVIVQLTAAGYGVDEISEITQLTYKQVESRLGRLRTKAKEVRDGKR